MGSGSAFLSATLARKKIGVKGDELRPNKNISRFASKLISAMADEGDARYYPAWTLLRRQNECYRRKRRMTWQLIVSRL
jgi:hypothetical protein